MRVKKEGRRGFRLSFPVFLIWILLFALLLALSPLILIAAALTWRQGPGKVLLAAFPMLCSLVFSLSGLHVEVESPAEKIFFVFH